MNEDSAKQWGTKDCWRHNNHPNNNQHNIKDTILSHYMLLTQYNIKNVSISMNNNQHIMKYVSMNTTTLSTELKM